MKTLYTYNHKKFFIILCFLLCKMTSFGQGRVVINEYMPWTNNGCGTTSEFIELMNFGPGPMDISCYILTDGDYSITIPANTILQPGQYYVVAGQDIISAGCANIDSSIQVNLNWNTCNCTSAPIPTTGDGLFTDGGSANEMAVLLSPTLEVVDAVVRAISQETSSLITTASMNGCAPQTFDLDLMNINYEVIGESAGRGNAFARETDGDCQWVKETAQSAGATNNKAGDNSSVNYTFNYTNTNNCNGIFGGVAITVQSSNNTVTFPMSYILAYDLNNDQVFDFSDQYTYGTDITPNTIEISGLISGKYRLLVSTANGCSLKNFDFAILDCISVLPVKLLYFKHAKTEQQKHFFEWKIDEVQNVAKVYLEQSADNRNFTVASLLEVNNTKSGSVVFSAVTPASQNKYFRLRVLGKNGEVFYSPTINTYTTVSYTNAHTRIWPNPVLNEINIDLVSEEAVTAPYFIHDVSGQLIVKGVLQVGAGINHFTLPANKLRSGIYNLRVSNANGQSIFNGKLIKQ